MDIQEIKQLIKLVEKSDIGELELEEEGRKIRIAKNSSLAGSLLENGIPNSVILQPPAPALAAAPMQAPAPAAAPAPESNSSAADALDTDKFYEIRSPMVGTFYRSPSPEAAPYVEIGDQVSEGGKLCIIEAMKLMNEIESEVSGKIAKIMVDNSQPVEYNQVLFLIEK